MCQQLTRESGLHAGTRANFRWPGSGSAQPGWPRSSRRNAWLKFDDRMDNAGGIFLQRKEQMLTRLAFKCKMTKIVLVIRAPSDT